MYGRMTLDMRQIFSASQSSSIVDFFCCQQSRSASIATSTPLLLRHLKQSATVLAGGVDPDRNSFDVVVLDAKAESFSGETNDPK